MKKILLTTLSLPLLYGQCLAVDLSLGIKGGLNFCKFTGTDAGPNTTRTGLAGGAFATFDLSGFSLQPEILYSEKGAKYQGNISFVEKHDYLEFSLLMKFPVGEEIVPSLYIGPALGFLLKAEAAGMNLKDFVTSTDLGLASGIDVRTPFGVVADVRYNLGLNTFDKSGTYTVKHSTFSLMVGYAVF